MKARKSKGVAVAAAVAVVGIGAVIGGVLMLGGKEEPGTDQQVVTQPANGTPLPGTTAVPTVPQAANEVPPPPGWKPSN